MPEPEGSFEEFVATRSAGLLRLGYFLTQDRELAKDLVQEALAKAFRRWALVVRAGDSERYVRRIVVNEFTSWRRRRRNAELPLPIPEMSAGDGADARAEQAAMWHALSGLKPRQRAVLVLRYYEGLSDREIASLLGCPEGSVRGDASRAFAELRQHPSLGRNWSEPSDAPVSSGREHP